MLDVGDLAKKELGLFKCPISVNTFPTMHYLFSCC